MNALKCYVPEVLDFKDQFAYQIKSDVIIEPYKSVPIKSNPWDIIHSRDDL